MRTAGLGVLAGLVLVFAAGAASADPAFEVPVDSPGLTPQLDVPAVVVPGTPAVTLRVPSVTVPGVCDAAACRASTPLPSGHVTTPGMASAPLGTPTLDVPPACAPSRLACVEGAAVPAQTLAQSPAIEASEADIPALALPALCAVSPTPCFESLAYAGFPISVADHGPVILLPAVQVVVQIPAMAGAIPVGTPSLGEQGPTPLVVSAPFVGDVGFTLCAAACPAPTVDPVELTPDGPPQATVAVGDETTWITL